MEPIDLVKVWEAPDNSQLTPKQISIRLPLHVAAKINALSDLYPRRTKTEIIGDLLAAALDQVQNGFSEDPYDPEYGDASASPYSRFTNLVKKHTEELEKEAGISSSTAISQKPATRAKKQGKSK